MADNSGSDRVGEPNTSYLLRREAIRRAAFPAAGCSPPALEATLAGISAEVTAEAVERMSRDARSRDSPKSHRRATDVP